MFNSVMNVALYQITQTLKIIDPLRLFTKDPDSTMMNCAIAQLRSAMFEVALAAMRISGI